MKNALILLCLCIAIGLASCAKNKKETLRVGATSIPHGEILEFVKPILKEQNIDLDIVIIDDFNTPNRALADGDVDANFFQHLPFLEMQIEDFNYSLEPFASVHLEPMGLYSKKYRHLEEIPEKGTIALPSDPSNQSRALELLEHKGLLALKTHHAKTSLLDIKENPKQLKIIDIDSPLLTRSLDDVDAAVISTNFALLAGLSPLKDALAIEDKQSRYVNIIVIRKGESARADLQALKKVLASEQVKNFIQDKYQGAVIPAF